MWIAAVSRRHPITSDPLTGSPVAAPYAASAPIMPMSYEAKTFDALGFTGSSSGSTSGSGSGKAAVSTSTSGSTLASASASDSGSGSGSGSGSASTSAAAGLASSSGNNSSPSFPVMPESCENFD